MNIILTCMCNLHNGAFSRAEQSPQHKEGRMETQRVFQERRRTIRKKCLKDVFLVNPSGIHQILDISTGGLSFRCNANESFPIEWTVDILVAETQIYIKKVPVRHVREYDENLITFISPPTKNVGVMFGDLEEQAISQLLEVLYLPEN
jgi:hypothetical protein